MAGGGFSDLSATGWSSANATGADKARSAAAICALTGLVTGEADNTCDRVRGAWRALRFISVRSRVRLHCPYLWIPLAATGPRADRPDEPSSDSHGRWTRPHRLRHGWDDHRHYPADRVTSARAGGSRLRLLRRRDRRRSAFDLLSEKAGSEVARADPLGKSGQRRPARGAWPSVT